MTNRIALFVAAAAFAIVSTTASAQERPRSYDPAVGAPKAAVAAPAATTANATTDKVNAAKATAMKKQRQEAQQRFAGWQNETERCMIEAGLSKEKGHFIVKPGNVLTYQVHDNVWLQPDRFNLDKLETCR